MATGDTIPGKVRVVREDTEGNRTIVAGPFSTSDLDDFNQQFQPEDYLYVNTELSDRISAPLQARELKAPQAQFASGEKLILQFQANQTVANDVDHDADSIGLSVLRMDKNRGKVYPDTLTVADQELSSDVSESASSYSDVFRETIPDRTEYRMVGSQAYAPVEN